MDSGLPLDRLIDQALEDLTAGAPRDGFRGRVMARIAEASEPAPVRFIELFGWRIRPFQLAAAGATLGVLALVVVIAPRLWPAQETGPASSPLAEQRGAPVTPAASPAAVAAGMPQAGVEVAGAGGRPHVVRVALGRPAPSPIEPADDESEATSPIPPVFITPLAPPAEITIAPIEIQPVTIQDITIQEIQITPIPGGRLRQ